MQGTIVDRPLAHFVGMKITATYDTLVELIPQVRKALLARQYEISGIVHPDVQQCVTLPQDTEAGDGQVTTYFGFEVAAYKEVPSDLIAIDLLAGKYAQFSWQGSFESDEFDYFYPSIFNWFKENNVAPSDNHAWVEIYGKDNDWDNRGNPRNEVTVLMPLGGAAAS